MTAAGRHKPGTPTPGSQQDQGAASALPFPPLPLLHAFLLTLADTTTQHHLPCNNGGLVHFTATEVLLAPDASSHYPPFFSFLLVYEHSFNRCIITLFH